MRPHDTQCKGPWPVRDSGVYYDQWVEPGQLRQIAGKSIIALVIGACDEQDPHQHDRTISWLVLFNDRIHRVSLSEIGEWWLVYPVPVEA